MIVSQQLTAVFQQLPEEEVKALLVEIFIARNYGNQEMIMKMNEIAQRYNLQ